MTAELQSLREHIQTVKPLWKKTWEDELPVSDSFSHSKAQQKSVMFG